MKDKKINWTIMAAIVLLVGLFVVFASPGLFDTTKTIQAGHSSKRRAFKPPVRWLFIQWC